MYHPLNVEIGRNAVTASEKMSRWLKRAATGTFRGKKSQWRALNQLLDVGSFSVTSRMCQWVLGFSNFFLLHVILLSFSEEQRRVHIKSDWTVWAYLPVHFESTNWNKISGDHEVSMKREKKNSKTREDVLWDLHESTHFSLNNVKRTDLNGFQCKTVGNHHILIHLMLSSYIADIPE